jgi:hypothetical protein
VHYELLAIIEEDVSYFNIGNCESSRTACNMDVLALSIPKGEPDITKYNEYSSDFHILGIKPLR